MLPFKVRQAGHDSLSTFGLRPWDLDSFFEPIFSNCGDDICVGAYPVDIHEEKEHLYVEAELPGFSKDEINVTLEDFILTIEANRKPSKADGAKHLTERRYTHVTRRFRLPKSVSRSNVDAKLDQGVLTLKLGKRKVVNPQKIEVR